VEPATGRRRVLVLFESGRGGGAALDLGRELALAQPTELTVVCVAPQATSGARCGNSALDYNNVLAETTAKDLDRACERLAGFGVAASYELLLEGVDPPLERFTADGAFELVLLPARRRPLRGAGHPAAARLARVARAEVRVIDQRSPVHA
jgi:hypothetical protein